MSQEFQSIVHVVAGHAGGRSAHDAIIFLERGEAETERVSYSALEAIIASRAAGLAKRGLAGKPIVIAMQPGAEFVALFLGCLRIGAICVPVPFPDTERNSARFSTILADVRPAAIFTNLSAVPRLERNTLGTEILAAETLDGVAEPLRDIAADCPAFIQYTSGSTQSPKGIVITHGNLIANQTMIRSAFGLPISTVGVSWLPHFHDMGLIGTILQPLFLGGTAVLMPPRAFVQKPIRWLRAIAKYGGTTSGAPCFGYDLCTRMVSPAEAVDLDLSSWNVAFCGAEPIRIPTLEKFSAHFRASGFRDTAFLPCYGLAETTLIATCADRGKGLSEREIEGRAFVSCGRPVEGGAVLLRDREICVGGPHLSPGSWDGERGKVIPFTDTFTRSGITYKPTGDIGAIVDGEIYVIDRLGDFIILYGAKTHAADIEATALKGEDEIRAAVAFAADDGARERLVVLCEIDRRMLTAQAELGQRLSKRIAEVHGVLPTVHFVAYGALPRTSSGKIQRFASRTNFLSGVLGMPKG